MTLFWILDLLKMDGKNHKHVPQMVVKNDDESNEKSVKHHRINKQEF